MSLYEKTIKIYNTKSTDFFEKYESLEFENVHSEVMRFINPNIKRVLDIGSGSGRDSAWFAKKHCQVTAVDPSSRLLSLATEKHRSNKISWINDSLPKLDSQSTRGLYDLIWLSAVWMHIHPIDRPSSFERIVSLLKDDGLIMISLRYSESPDSREMFSVSVEEIYALCKKHGFHLEYKTKDPVYDKLGRTQVLWKTLVIKKK